jgi:hypothetical protein
LDYVWTIVKTIETLIPDIQEGFEHGFRILNEEGGAGLTRAFGDSLATFLVERLTKESSRPSLRLSNAGTPCDRKLWYSINKPELGERLSGSTRLKFLYGDILEQLILFLARSAGHTVADEQREVEIQGVRGHIDAFIDGHLVDVKSASTYSFNKFQAHLTAEDDSFGYLGQLSAYAHAVGVSEASFLVVDKTLGHLCLDTHDFTTYDIVKEVERKKNVVNSPQLPPRGYSDEADGQSGNRKLSTVCSYCSYKESCWPGLRTFGYAGHPKFLTQVRRLPRVREG